MSGEQRHKHYLSIIFPSRFANFSSSCYSSNLCDVALFPIISLSELSGSHQPLLFTLTLSRHLMLHFWQLFSCSVNECTNSFPVIGLHSLPEGGSALYSWLHVRVTFWLLSFLPLSPLLLFWLFSSNSLFPNYRGNHAFIDIPTHCPSDSHIYWSFSLGETKGICGKVDCEAVMFRISSGIWWAASSWYYQNHNENNPNTFLDLKKTL